MSLYVHECVEVREQPWLSFLSCCDQEVLWDRVFHWLRAHQVLCWLSTEHQVYLRTLHHTGFKCEQPTHTWLFQCGPRSWIRSSCLYSKYLIDRAISAALDVYFVVCFVFVSVSPILQIESEASCMQGKHSTGDPHPGVCLCVPLLPLEFVLQSIFLS